MATSSSTARSGKRWGIAPSAYASTPREGGARVRRWPGVLPDTAVHDYAKPCIIMHSRAGTV